MAEHPPRSRQKREEDDVVTNEIKDILFKAGISEGIEVDTKNVLYKKGAKERLQREMDDLANSPPVPATEPDVEPVEPVLHKEEESEPPVEAHVPNDSADAIDQGHVQKVFARSENTPLEWREKLRGLIGGAKNAPESVSERFSKSKNYLNERAKEIDAQAEMSGLEKAFRRMGENYNKLTLVHKLGIGVALGAGAVVSVASFAPVMALGFGAALGVQRAYGLGGAFVSREKALQAKKVGESEQLLSVKESAMLGAMLYTIGMSFAIKGGVELANEYGVVERAREWFGGMFGEHQAVREISAPEAPAVEVVVPPPEPPPAPIAPGMPSISVEATRGRGYEYMMKRVWEQLQEKGLDANQYVEGSDIRRLLEADAQSIDKVVHQIAGDPEHGFFNPDGTSVRIDMDLPMTINTDGNIRLGDAVKAPEGAPVTPIYHPETSVPDAETPVAPAVSAQEVALPKPATAGMTYAPEPVGEPYVETPPASPADKIATQSPAPIVERSFVSNRFGLPISTAEPHVYAGADARNIFVFGGTPIERAGLIQQYLTENPNKIVLAADDNGEYRIPWHLVGGRVEPAGAPVRAEGFFNSIFNFFRGSSWMKAPQPDEFKKIIK